MLAKNSNVITQTDSLKIDTFYNCVRDKAETIGSIPFKLRKFVDGNRTLVESGREHRIFTQQPNDYMTWQGMNEMIIATMETCGVFYAYKNYNRRGNLAEIIPFANQSGVSPNMDVYGKVYYTYVTNSGDIVVSSPDDLMIVSLFSLDGFRAVRPIALQADLLGLAKVQEESYSELQKNGITSQMALGTESVFKNNDAAARLKQDWEEFRGPQGRGKIPLLENGLKPINLNLTPQEMDLLNQRQFTVERIHAMTRVPAYRTGVNVKSSDKIFELDEAYLRNSCNPSMKKIEFAINQMLPVNYMIEFERNSFYAGSPWRLVDSIDKAIKCGVKSINEGRRDMGMEPVDGGDVFVIQSNNAVYGRWDQLPDIREQINGQGSSTAVTEESSNDA